MAESNKQKRERMAKEALEKRFGNADKYRPGKVESKDSVDEENIISERTVTTDGGDEFSVVSSNPHGFWRIRPNKRSPVLSGSFLTLLDAQNAIKSWHHMKSRKKIRLHDEQVNRTKGK